MLRTMKLLIRIALASALVLLTFGPVGAAVPGETVWVARFMPGEQPEVADLHVAPSGNAVFVAGMALRDHLTVAYDAQTGAELWQGLQHGTAMAKAIAVAPDGSRVFTTGGGFVDASGRWASLTIAYDASSGTKLWTRRGNGGGWGEDVAPTPDGSMVLVTGAARGWEPDNPFDSDPITIAYDASTGATVWKARFGRGDAHGYSLAMAPDGQTAYVAGDICCVGRNYYDGLLVAYRVATGERVWSRVIPGPLTNSYVSVGDQVVSPDSQVVFVAGTSTKASGRTADSTIAFHASTGVRAWARDDVVSGNVELDPAGRHLYVAGDSSKGDISITALRAGTGGSVWTKRYDGPAGLKDTLQDLAVGPEGSAACVGGATFTGVQFDWDYVTLCYRPDGTRLLARRFDGPASGFDRGAAIGLAPDGSAVFVSGVSQANASRFDLDVATIRYALT
jgi:PQQ-like domain